MSTDTIQKLFANDISRRIEEVIKVDQADEAIIKDELTEYVVTDSIRATSMRCSNSIPKHLRSPMRGSVSGSRGSLDQASRALPRIWVSRCKTAPSQGKVLRVRLASGSAIRKPKCCSRASLNRSPPRR